MIHARCCNFFVYDEKQKGETVRVYVYMLRVTGTLWNLPFTCCALREYEEVVSSDDDIPGTRINCWRQIVSFLVDTLAIPLFRHNKAAL